MKGYFVHFNARDTAGVSKKIDMQLGEFARHHEIQEIDIRMSNKSFWRNAMSVLPYVSICWDYTDAYRCIANPDFLYIRKVGGDYKHYKFLRYIKERFPDCKVLIEIPTYPYFWEGVKSITGILLVKDYYNYCCRLKRYIDRIVTYSDDKKIFGIPTLCVKNGIDVQSIQPIGVYPEYNPVEINLIAVAVMRPHHGYERIIEGLYRYYNDNGRCNFHIHMVGDGIERNVYEKLIQEYRLETHFTFYGMKSGNELHEIYCKADIALSAFGWYKDRVRKSSTLKVREYLAKGLPVISGCREDAFDGTDGKFSEIFPNDNSPVDFNRVASFYERIYKNCDRKQVIENVRAFAKDHVDNCVTMKPIMDYIAENDKI